MSNPSNMEEADAIGAREQDGGAPPDLRVARRDRAARREISPDSIERLPPHSEAAERGVLGCVMLSPNDSMADLVGIGTVTEWFYDLKHQTIWDAMTEMFDANEPIDLITLQQRLKDNKILDQVGGIVYLGGLSSDVPSAANTKYYADICREKFIARSIVRVCTQLAGDVYEFEGEIDQLLDIAETRILKIGQARNQNAVRVIREVVPEALEDIERTFTSNGEITGIPTGFPDLDMMIDGLQPGNVFVLAARPGFGKTSLLMNMIENAALAGYPCGVNSLEMTARALVKRAICAGASVNLRRIRGGDIGKDDFSNISRTATRLIPAPIYIDDTAGLSIMALRARARRMVQQYGIKVLGIDYLQLMHSTSKKADNRNQEVSDISCGIKALAKELNIAVILLSQLNREMDKEKGRKPRLSDLRESGSIEQDADEVAMLYRPSFGENDRDAEAQAIEEVVPMNLWIGKSRNGPVGDIQLTFFKNYTRYESAARVSDSDVPQNDNYPPPEPELPIEPPPLDETQPPPDA